MQAENTGGPYRVLWDEDRHDDFVNLEDAQAFAEELLPQPTERLRSYILILDLSEQDRRGRYRVLWTRTRPITDYYLTASPATGSAADQQKSPPPPEG